MTTKQTTQTRNRQTQLAIIASMNQNAVYFNGQHNKEYQTNRIRRFCSFPIPQWLNLKN